MAVLGIPISITNLANAVERITAWAREGAPSLVFLRDVPSLMVSFDDVALQALHDKARLVLPDGMPLVWIGRWRAYGLRIGRVAGADLVDALCKRSVSTGQSHFFYGGKPGVAETMAGHLKRKYPGLKVAGVLSPPMRTIDAQFAPDAEARSEIERIREADADFVWVGLSSPKQEFWIASAAPLVGRGVFMGVGAAFDFHAGSVARAPAWMRNNGLEWLHRLLSEPRRLWRRYLVLAPKFVLAILGEQLSRRPSGSVKRPPP